MDVVDFDHVGAFAFLAFVFELAFALVSSKYFSADFRFGLRISCASRFTLLMLFGQVDDDFGDVGVG